MAIDVSNVVEIALEGEGAGPIGAAATSLVEADMRSDRKSRRCRSQVVEHAGATVQPHDMGLAFARPGC
jgi:hypothetical protein